MKVGFHGAFSFCFLFENFLWLMLSCSQGVCPDDFDSIFSFGFSLFSFWVGRFSLGFCHKTKTTLPGESTIPS